MGGNSPTGLVRQGIGRGPFFISPASLSSIDLLRRNCQSPARVAHEQWAGGEKKMERWTALLAAGTCCLLTGMMQAQTIRETDCHTGPVSTVAFTPDGKTVVSGGFDHALVCLQTASGMAFITEKLHSAKIVSLAVSPDGQQWAIGHSDRKITRIGPVSLDFTPRLVSDEQPTYIQGLVFSPDIWKLLACTEDGFVRVWDIRPEGQEPAINCSPGLESNAGNGWHICESIRVGPSALYALAISPDGQTIATAGLEGTIYLIDPVSRAVLHTMPGHRDAVYALHFSADGKLLASGSGDGTVRLWDPKSGKQVGCLSGHSDAVYSVAFDARGQRLLSADRAGLVVVRDATTWATVYNHRLPGKILCAALSPDGRHIAAGNACGKCYLIDLP
jgi:WD40 repeat protein